MKNNKLSLTVGIVTCYGDNSILDTVKSIRASKGVGNFRFIIVADRVPINPWLKSQLKKYSVEVIENKGKDSQISKQKQILTLTKSDLILFTQDDVLFEPQTLKTVIKRFEKNPKTSFISILNKPVKPTNFFEGCLNVGTNIANKMAKYWNNGDNYLSVIGRFMAFRTEFAKNNINLRAEVATSDAYYYFSNKLSGGNFEYIPQVGVMFKNPQNMKEHLRKSSRFQYSKIEMSKYFENLNSFYKVPQNVVVKALAMEFLSSPIIFMCYIGIFIYTRILRMKPHLVLNAIWEVDLSTKRVLAK